MNSSSNPQHKVVGFDVETDLISMDNKTPQLVCLTLAGGEDTSDLAASVESLKDTEVRWGPTGWRALVGAGSALEAYRAAVSEAQTLVAHNMPYDVGVLANHCQDIHAQALNPVLVDAVALIEEGALSDTLVREKLITIALDYHEYDKRCVPPRKTLFNLAHLVYVYFQEDITGDKVKLEKLQKDRVPKDLWPWRYRYIDLANTPVRDWPTKAADYAIEDAVWARLVYLEQARPLVAGEHTVVTPQGAVINEREQTAAHFALHMMSIQGAEVDPEMVDRFEEDIDGLLVEYNRAIKALGIVRINRCYNCAEDKSGGTGFIGSFPNLRVCPICQGMDHQDCLDKAVYTRAAASGIGKVYTKRLKQIVRWGYRGDPPMTDRPRKQSKKAYDSWTPSVKTDDETLAAITHPEVERYCLGKKATKWKSTYLPQLREALGTDRTTLAGSFNVLVRSGRTSAFSPNLQNPPRAGRYRECLRAAYGRLFASVDYSSLEMATFAQVCLTFFGESRMAELINEGVDLHAWFGAKLLGITYEEMNTRLAAGDSRAKSIRQLAKIPNFGMLGGLGAKGLVGYARGYGVDLELDSPTTNEQGVELPSAYDLCKAWKKSFPETAAYFGYLSSMSDMGSGRFTIQQVGSNRVRGGATYTSGANTFFQGLAADGAKAAMWALFKACYTETDSPLFGCRVWNFVHDEFLLEGPDDTAHLWAPEVTRIMVEAMRAYTPDVRQAAPPALMARWYKGADPVYDDEGNLIAWTPFADLPDEAQTDAPSSLSKNGKVLYASGYMDAFRAGANHDEAVESGIIVAEHGRIG